MSPAERGALEEILRQINAGQKLTVKGLEGKVSDEHFSLLQAIHKPLHDRQEAALNTANAEATRIVTPPAVEAYKNTLSIIRHNNRAGEGRLKRNRARIVTLEAKIASDEAREVGFQNQAWSAHNALTVEERRWLMSGTPNGFPHWPHDYVPLAVVLNGAENADIEAIRKFVERLLAEDQS